MVTNPLYKSYSRQLAKLFCSEDTNKILCEASIEERLNTYLDNYTYSYFLSKLNQGRIYITNVENLLNKGFRMVVTDIMTGERVTAWWEHQYNLPYLSKIRDIMLSHQYNIISDNKTFNDDNKYDLRITWNPTKENYGISFVPQSVPGYVPPGSVPKTTPIPDQPKQTPAIPNLNFNEMLSNPIVLIGGAIVLFLLMKDKF